MLKIQREANGEVVFTLSGRMDGENVAELLRLFNLETAGRHLVLNLKDVTLADRDAVQFLAGCEEDGLQLDNCPPYIREWIKRERETKQPNKRPNDGRRSGHRRSH